MKVKDILSSIAHLPSDTEISFQHNVMNLHVLWKEDIFSITNKNIPDEPVGLVKHDTQSWKLFLKIPDENKKLFPTIVVPVNFTGKFIGERAKPESWGLKKLGSTVWSLDPSIVMGDWLHAFVTIINVPEIPPWEQI